MSEEDGKGGGSTVEVRVTVELLAREQVLITAAKHMGLFTSKFKKGKAPQPTLYVGSEDQVVAFARELVELAVLRTGAIVEGCAKDSGSTE